MGLSEQYVRDIEEKHGGARRWVSKPKDANQDLHWKLMKRVTWSGACGGGVEGAYFVSSTSNRLFLMHCNTFTVINGAQSQPTIGTGLIVYAASLMDCIDRCASDQYFVTGTGGGTAQKCRVAEHRSNGECRMGPIYGAGTSSSYMALSTGFAIASYITTATCTSFDTAATPLHTPCGSVSAGTIPNPSTSVIAPGTTTTYTFSQTSNFATRTPTAVAGEQCTAFPLNNVCGAS